MQLKYNTPIGIIPSPTTKVFFPFSPLQSSCWSLGTRCDGLRHNLHLWIRFTAPRHSPPGGTLPQTPLPDAHEKQSGFPAWSLLFVFPLDPPLAEWPALIDLSSSLSSWILLRFANLLSLLACFFFDTSGSFSTVSTFTEPGRTDMTADSEATTGAPFPPAANHAAAGMWTFSFQYVTSFVNSTSTQDHGAPGPQSLGICLPTDWSKRMDLLNLDIFSALAWSSADATKPQAEGHCKTNFSMCREYVSNELKVAMLSIKQAVLNTLQLAIQAWNDAGPGRSFCKKDPSPNGVNTLNLCAFDIFLSKGNQTPKSQ